MISREGLANDLNTGRAERLKAVVAGLLLLSILALPFALQAWPVPLGLAVVALGLNWRLASFFYRLGGLGFAAASIAYHQFYYVYSAGAFAWCLFEYHVLGRRNRLHVP
jgi:hypothetical protein